jgi:hypothetical protein
MYDARNDLPGRGMCNRVDSVLLDTANYVQLFVVNAGKPEECYVVNGNERERILGTLAQIDRALMTTPTSDPSIPNIEFSFLVSHGRIPKSTTIFG